MRGSYGMVAALLLYGIAAQGDVPVTGADQVPGATAETPEQRDARMAWWREARFGLFIHWGLYAIPAGTWGTETHHAEWIRTTARIPLAEYDKLVAQFNPVKFDADAWVRWARDAGMRYIVITSKHHDGFALFDSVHSDFDLGATPFKRDILGELADACRQHGVRLCLYHSIMDWHHPDYLPRRDWEHDRLRTGADFERYVTYMKNQLRELVTRYGPLGVLWFDGEWEATWNHERGLDLYRYVRGLQPDIIINNRVDVGRGGAMSGLSHDARFAGDYGTPEQEVPLTGLPGVDWETCLTMNDHWGYNAHDEHWKSAPELIRTLIDVASKGGNLLLNVGPTAAGEFPPAAIERLQAMGAWLRVNGAAIYGTQASPFQGTPWGRCTQQALPGGQTRLYLHVFDWPADGRLVVSGLLNEPRQARLLADMDTPCPVAREEDALVITVPRTVPESAATVVLLDIVGRPEVAEPPTITAPSNIFVETLAVNLATSQSRAEVRYTTDGSVPTGAAPVAQGPVVLERTTTLKARTFRGGRPISAVSTAIFERVTPRAAEAPAPRSPGLAYTYYEGTWDRLPDFTGLSATAAGVVPACNLSMPRRAEYYGLELRGFISVPTTGVYRFHLLSDDGARLYIGDALVVDNDGLHAATEAAGTVALAAGAHPVTVRFFQKTGDTALEVRYEGPKLEKQRVPDTAWSHAPGVR